MANVKKTTIVSDITDTLSTNKNFSLIKFENTTHQNMEGLRKSLLKTGSSMHVVKNSLLSKALRSTRDQAMNTLFKSLSPLKEKTAIITLSNEWNDGIKTFFTYSEKDTTVTFRGGILDGTYYGADDLIRIAKLPPKEHLIAKVIGGLKSPMHAFVYNIKNPMQKLVYVLNAKSQEQSA